jgi:rsbT co-antagonist protein RsbR
MNKDGTNELIAKLQEENAELRRQNEELRALIDAIPAVVFVKTRAHRYTFVNRAFAEFAGKPVEEILGQDDTAIWSPNAAKAYIAGDEAVMATGKPQTNVEEPISGDNEAGWLATSKVPLHDVNGVVTGMIGISIDISERKRMEERLQELVVRQEQMLATIRDLAVPVVPVYDGVLIVPLVGQIDDARSAQISETLLEAIVAHQAEYVLIDITGVTVVDTAVVAYLVQVTQAAGLLGAHCVLVGVAPEVAQTLVGLGIDLGRLLTRSNLQGGLAYALSQQGRTIVLVT